MSAEFSIHAHGKCRARRCIAVPGHVSLHINGDSGLYEVEVSIFIGDAQLAERLEASINEHLKDAGRLGHPVFGNDAP